MITVYLKEAGCAVAIALFCGTLYLWADIIGSLVSFR